jgi:signal transduction histidine kinase/CheY-like chemotaxis protein
MRLASAAVTVAALLLLLTWLLMRGIDVNARPFEQTLAALDEIELAESAMQRDVLSARAGLLRNYDPLVREVQLLEDAVARLRGPLVDAALVDRLAVWLVRQEALLEEFKSVNALLQNSLAQFGLLVGRFAEPNDSGPSVPDAGALASAMLRLTLDTSPEAAREVERRLDEFAPALTQDPVEPTAALLAHGRLLHKLLPQADSILRALLSTPSQPERQAIRAAILAHRDASERSARRYRILLYAASVLLLGLLVHLGLQLRSRALALRRRAAFEHVLADVSTGLISVESYQVGERVEQVLGRIAECVGADRAYLLLTGPAYQEYSWSADGITFPSGWPAEALAIAARHRPTQEGIIRITRGRYISDRGNEEALATAGLRGWFAAVRTNADGEVNCLLGCDVVRRSGSMASLDDLGPLRLALDAVANVVERAGLERERVRLEARLEQARRMEMVGAFASGIAHNFNNILGAILGYTEMAEEIVGPGSHPIAARLAEIRRAGERARDLVDQILTFGRRREVVRRPLFVHALVKEAEALLHASLPAGAGLVLGKISEKAAVSGDAAQLQQVIVNLCRNAAQAMDDCGTIVIEVEERAVVGARKLSHGELEPGRYVVISVSDTGRGMDETTLGRIFEPFFTTRAAGHGLGLSTVREIVLEHGGAIDVRSSPGAGTRFEVWLPRTDAAELGAQDALPPDVALGHGETLLLVEDDADHLRKEEDLLATLGYEPVGFTDASNALSAHRAAPGRFDGAVICQLEPMAPVSDLVAAVRDVTPELPIILAVASTRGIDAEALVVNGVAEIVHWPLARAELALALQRCLSLRDQSAGALRP